MDTSETTSITVETQINGSLETVWDKWTSPYHILQWNNASEDWHTRKAENDLWPGGKFLSRMEAKDGSFGFDFGGTYDEIKPMERIAYTMDDNRKVIIRFSKTKGSTVVTETFEAESSNAVEMQKEGWQAILNNFKKYVEEKKDLVTLHFEIKIDAAPEKVQETMLEDKAYRKWTAYFSPNSYFEGSWKKGSKIKFLGPNEGGKPSGMLARIKENIAGQVVSIDHYGMIDNGEEITSGNAVEEWKGALENYYFREEGGATILTVVADTTKEYENSMAASWPKALEELKSICES